MQKLIDKAEYCINPFPVLVKATGEEIDEIIEADPLLKNRSYQTRNVKISDLYGLAAVSYTHLRTQISKVSVSVIDWKTE